ncbi:unnamed protein product [Caenorhabditis brenneri]
MLLRLPYLVQMQIIKQLELYEYFFLGLCSKRTKLMLQRTRCHSFDKAVINTFRSALQVQKIPITGEKVVMYSAKNNMENMHLRHDVKFWDRRIQLGFRNTTIRCRISTHPTLNIPILWCKSKHQTLLPMALHHYICDVFHLYTDIQIIFRFSHLSDFPDTLEVDNLWEYASQYQEGYAQFFDRINIRNSLNLSEFLTLEVFHKILSVEHILIQAAQYISVEYLWQFRGCTAVFEMVNFISNHDLVLFLNNWLEGDNRKLEVILVRMNYASSNTFDKEEVLRNFDVKPWDPKRRARRFFYPDGWRVLDEADPADCTEGMDIERNDGMLATVIITPTLFRFFVWHQRFPDPVKNKPMIKPPMVGEQKWMMVGNIFF